MRGGRSYQNYNNMLPQDYATKVLELDRGVLPNKGYGDLSHKHSRLFSNKPSGERLR
jgi:hypothetical protein